MLQGHARTAPHARLGDEDDRRGGGGGRTGGRPGPERRAAAAGVMISVDSDCHHASRLGAQMRYGVGTARRGWITSDHIVNARPLSAIRDIVRHKRATARG